MTISRGQMKRQLYEGGGIMSLSKEGIGGGDYKGIDMGSRTGFGILKKITGGVKKAVKGATKAVKGIVSSDVGKAALLAAAGAYAGGLGPFGATGSLSGIRGAGFARGLFPSIMDYSTPTRSLFTNIGKIGSKGLDAVTGGGMKDNIGKFLGLGALTGFLTSQYGMTEEQAEEALTDPESRKSYLRMYYTNLNPNAGSEEIENFVETNTSEYAVGGRVGFDEGSPGMNRRLDMDVLQDFLDKGGMDPDMIVPEPEQSPDATPIPEGMMINPLQTAEFRDANRNGIEDRREGIYLEKDFIPKKDPEEFDIDLFKKYFEETKEFREVPRKNEAKGTGDPQEGINSLKPLADEQASLQYELPFGEPLFVVKQAGRLFGVFEQKDGSRILLPMDKSGSRLDLADAGPVLPPDPTQPVNPFGPKPPADAPVLPDRMASNMENDKILEALFEKYIDMGFSPKEAADKAREEFDRMSMGKKEKEEV
jgi:hypothetical protein